ncbi:M56 family metallopeptidase [Streptomyces sp. NPDC087420]|uniref:M56 family metallopeptidase n=1 Tax=Streptomyces sp. NPDC087420 TaxID=3365785 RepID=UPI00383367CF
MRVVVFLPFVVSGLLAVSAPWAGRRLPPRTASWLLTAASTVAAGGWTAALSMLAFTLVGQVPAVAEEGRWSPGALAASTPVNRTVAAGATLLLAGCVAALAVAAWRRARLLVAARRESRLHPGRGDLVVLDDPVPTAFALPGSPGRVVVSSGMLRALSADERRALMAHERAHLHHRHHLFLLVLQLTAALNPLLRPVANAGGFALERWADEHAGTVVADRPLVARAVARAALATKRGARPALAATGGPVPQRVRALLSPLLPYRRRWVAALSFLMIVCCVSVLMSAQDMDQLFDAASYAPFASRR